MSEHILKRHNKIGERLKNICLEISERYEVHVIEIGYESNHVHFLVQSVPNYSISKMVRMLKYSISWLGFIPTSKTWLMLSSVSIEEQEDSKHNKSL